MVQIPDRYDPITIGRPPYVAEMVFTEPFVYVFGFEETLSPQSALETAREFGGIWALAEPDRIEALTTDRTEYRLVHTDGAAPISPADLRAFSDDESNQARYIIPVYTSRGQISPAATLIPNHVVVTSPTLAIEWIGALDMTAAEQEFFPLEYRDSFIGNSLRRIYSSLVTAAAMEPPDETLDYRGEPGPALWLIDTINRDESGIGAALVAEPDWYIAHPNDLGTAATTAQADSYGGQGEQE